MSVRDEIAREVHVVWGNQPYEGGEILAVFASATEANRMLDILRAHQAARPENKYSGTFDWDGRDMQAFDEWVAKEPVTGSWSFPDYSASVVRVYDSVDAIVAGVIGRD